jgi:GTP-binding protein
MIDGKSSLTSQDHDIVAWVRKKKKRLLFIANKIDDGQTDHLFEYAEFGFGIPLGISAKNYTGIWELEDTIEDNLRQLGFGKQEETHREDDSVLKVAFIGRPNVGKSSLFNHIIGQDRSIVSDIAGTTRDSIDSEWTDGEGNQYLFLDTAGLRKPGKIERNIEFWSSVRTRRAIEQCHIGVLLIDALDGVTHQDLALAGMLKDAGKGIIIGGE